MTEKRTFSGMPLSSNKHVNGSNGQVSQRIKNFFRINSNADTRKHSDEGNGAATPKSEKSGFRQSRFLPHISRNRSTTVTSEGNPLDDAVSPIAHANPYFQHQGPPAIRHHNAGSVPPSPPDTPNMPTTKIDGASGANDQATAAGKEELARKLRRVASAPNAQGLFSSSKSDGRPQTAELGKQPVLHHPNSSTLSMVETVSQDQSHLSPEDAFKGIPSPGQIRQSVAFRRTYSSNSIKVRNVEVGPGSFDKIKLIGKGDVGKVYLVREKKSSRLYAMKGKRIELDPHVEPCANIFSAEQEGNDQAKQDQAGTGRTGDPGYQQPSLHCHPLPLVPVRRPLVSLHGILQWRRVLQGAADSAKQVCRRRCGAFLCS
jgi:protein-serine/threonine kinase